jgi:hypothetical protein
MLTLLKQNKLSFKYLCLIFIICLSITGCKKKTEEVYVANIFEQYFEQNILNNDFIVSYSKNQGIENTSEFDGYRFRLLKNTYYDGPMTATKNGITYSGTWSSNSDYGKLIININQPSIPTEFIFLNRSWRFTEKALPIMKLAPWGSTEDSELHMQRQ